MASRRTRRLGAAEALQAVLDYDSDDVSLASDDEPAQIEQCSDTETSHEDDEMTYYNKSDSSNIELQGNETEETMTSGDGTRWSRDPPTPSSYRRTNSLKVEPGHCRQKHEHCC